MVSVRMAAVTVDNCEGCRPGNLSRPTRVLVWSAVGEVPTLMVPAAPKLTAWLEPCPMLASSLGARFVTLWLAPFTAGAVTSVTLPEGAGKDMVPAAETGASATSSP